MEQGLQDRDPEQVDSEEDVLPVAATTATTPGEDRGAGMAAVINSEAPALGAVV